MARDLRRRKAREKQQLFVAEGVRAVEELLRSPLSIRGALVGPQLLEAPRGPQLVAAIKARGTSVEDVASEVGYEDAGFFSRLFRRHVSLTPAQYRKRFGAMRRALAGRDY